MPAEPLDKYVHLGDTFIAHWGQVNTSLAPKVLLLAGGYTAANLQSDRNALAATLAGISDADNEVQGLRARRSTQQTVLKERLRQLRNAVLGQLPGTETAAKLPLIPTKTASPEVWTRAFDDMASVWQSVETAPPVGYVGPLTLADGYTRAAFTTELAALKTTYTALIAAEGRAKLLRQTRTTQAKGIRARLVAYRKAVVGVLASGNPLLAALPSL